MPILDAGRALPSLAPTVRVAAWVSLAATLPTGLVPFGPGAIFGTFNAWRGVLLPLLGGWISVFAVCALVFLAAEALGLRRFWIVRALAVICLTRLILEIVAVSAQTDWFAILHRLGLDGILTTRAQKLIPRNVLFAALGGWLIYKTRNSDFFAKAIRFLRNVVIVFFLILIWRAAPLMFLSDEPVNTARSEPVENSVAYRPFIGDRAVVWVIFDELDYQIAFQEMSPQQLPRFHALARSGLSATNAYSPGNTTMSSMPQLITGTSARVENPSAHSTVRTLKMFPKSGAIGAGGVRVMDMGTVFAAVHSRRGSSEVFGYAHPYCDWSPEVDICQSISAIELPSWRAVALNSFHDLSLGMVYKVLPFDHLDQMTETTHRQSHYLENDFSAGSATLQFMHLNIPHPPAFAAAQYFNKPRPTNADAKGNYLLNLAYSDHVLGQLMTKVEAAARSKNILFVVSSDHGFKEGIPDGDLRKQHVPFILWQRGNQEGHVITAMFNTIITRRVIEAYLDGSFNTLEDIASFISSNSAEQ